MLYCGGNQLSLFDKSDTPVLPQLNGENFKLIKENKTLALIILLLACMIYQHIELSNVYEKKAQSDEKTIQRMEEIEKSWREQFIRSTEIEKASRKIEP